LIEETIDGVKGFLIQHCQIVFEEDERTAEWILLISFITSLMGYKDNVGMF